MILRGRCVISSFLGSHHSECLVDRAGREHEMCVHRLLIHFDRWMGLQDVLHRFRKLGLRHLLNDLILSWFGILYWAAETRGTAQ